MKKVVERLAYIKWPDGQVRIELIVLAKKGTGFHLKGEFWKRVEWLFMPYDDGHINSNQEVIRMSLLKPHFTPNWVDKNTIEVSQGAESKYRKWQQKFVFEARLSDIDSGVDWK